MRINALLMAGRRPGIDPLAAHFGVEDKALIPLAGESMLARVARVLVDHPAIGRITILAQEPEKLLAEVPWMANHPAITTHSGGMSLGTAIDGALSAMPGDFPFLVTTADNALLDAAMIDAFLDGAQGHDLAIGMVERQVLHARYPEARRTWLKFRGGAWSGANLFWFGTPAVRHVLGRWQTIEQQRKKGRAVIGAFGLPMLIAVALRLLDIHQAVARAGRRFGIDARVVPLPHAEACIDVDKPADHALATEILTRRNTN